MFRRLPTACAACALALATVTPSRADQSWTGATSTDWFTAGNWSTAVPTGTDHVTIDTVNPNATVVGTPGATAISVIVGNTATGMLTIQNGGTVSSGGGGDIGAFSGSTGAVTVTGAGSSWTTNSTGLGVGLGGTGTLTIQNGGTVSSNGNTATIGLNFGSTGNVTVTGAGSSLTTNSHLLDIGHGGTGTLTIQNGGTVSSGGGNIGFNSGSTGTVTVAGAGSSLTTSSGGLDVGLLGAGTLTIQNGGTVSSSGGGGIGFNSGGTATVTGAGSSWTISHGGLAIGVFDTGTLTIQDSGVVNVAGAVPIAQFAGSTGTLNIGAASGQPAAAPGTLNASSVAFGQGTGLLVFNHTAANYVFAPTISGAGSVRAEAGTTILTGSNTYTGGTTINAGATLQLGNGGGGGSIMGNVTDNGTLIFSRSDTFSFAGAISGSGGLLQNGPGTTMLTGASGYAGPTAINGGTLEVDGSIANSSSVTVAAGGTLSGTGAVGATTIMSGGTLAPGNPTHPTGALTITGNLAFQSGALYLVGVNPTSASSVNVSGTASLAGNVLAAFAPGSYVVRQYDILHSTGLGGTTFAALGTTNLPPNFAASLSYTSTDVFLNLNSQLGSSGGLNGNQQAVANSLNNFFNGGGTLPPNFLTIFGLTGGNLANALSQLSGEAADGEKGAFDLMTQFLGVMTDPHLGGPGSTAVLPFASEGDLPPEIALAYARALKSPGLAVKAPKAPPASGWSVWGSGFGGSNKTGGDAVVGSHDLTASDAGFAAGADYRVAPDTLVGFALAGGDTHWDLAQGLGGGRSDAFQAGVYGRRYFGGAYVAGAAAFANHWMKTNRVAPLGDQLAASFDAQVFGGRLEVGDRFALPAPGAIGAMIGVTPYAALQALSFHAGAYSETDLSGGGFALNHNAMNASDTRSELGARFDDLTVFSGMPLVLRSRLAWAHDWVSNPAIGAVFQALPGAAFTVNGAAPPKDSALTTAGFELRPAPNWSLGAKFEGEFAARSQTYAGTGTLRYTW